MIDTAGGEGLAFICYRRRRIEEITPERPTRGQCRPRRSPSDRWVVGCGQRGSEPIRHRPLDRPGRVGRVAVAGGVDLERAVEAATRGFAAWQAVAPFDRARVLRQAASLLRARGEAIAAILTVEQGKPLAQARHEILSAAETIDWFAEEGKRCFRSGDPWSYCAYARAHSSRAGRRRGGAPRH